jgi:subfamily B ATP-binding cassette protein MsbA
VSGDIEGIQGLFAETFLQIIRNVLTFMVGLVMIYWLNVKLALIATALLPVYIIALFSFNQRIRRLVEENREAYAHLFKYLQEHISGIAVLKAFVAEKRDTIGMLNLLKTAIRKEFASGIMGTVAMLAAGFVSSLGPILLLWFGIVEIVNGRLTLGGLIAFNSFLVYLFSPLNSISGINVTVQNSLACARRVFNFLDESPEFSEIPEDVIARTAQIRDGQVEFRNVRFSYNPGAADVLKDISFTAAAGRVTAIVGRSGVGKSSIVNLMLRFYDHQHGSIFIDGQGIKSFHPVYLRRNIGLVTQETFLFGYTIMENIRLGRLRASDDEVIEAAKAAYAHDFITDLPEQYQTRIGERGALISGGQRQRIALARVFLKNPRILILDEATSSLDSQSEQYVKAAMENLFEGRTVIIISHRLSTIINAHKIILLDSGSVIDIGDHETLYETNTLYRGLYDEQFSKDESKLVM